MNIGGTTQTATPTWNGEMSPRMKVTAVPYAFAAKEAQQLKVTNGANTTTISVTAPTANRTITFGDESGTVVLDSTLTTEGDIYYRNGSGLARLARGSNGECLTSNATTILWGSCGSAVTLQNAYDGGAAGDQIITLDATQDSVVFRNPASSGSDSTFTLKVEQLNTGSSADALVVTNSGTGNILNLQDAGTTVLKVTDGGYLVGNATATGTTGTSSGTGGIAVTTITLASAGSFANNDIIFVDNTGGSGQDYYTRIVSGGGTTTLTVSPAVSYGTTAGYTGNATITKYTAQNIGATGTDYTTQSNRFFQGYFLGGVVTGAGSTIYTDGVIASSPGLKIKNPSNSATAFQVLNTAGTGYALNVDTTNLRVGIGTNAPTYDLSFGGGSARTIRVETQTTANTAGSSLTVASATGNGTGAGGALTLQAGNSGSGATGNGGAISISGGAATSTNGSGGTITITAGAKTGSGSGGQVIIKPGTSSDRTDFFQIQNAASTPLLQVDSTNSVINTLNVRPFTDAATFEEGAVNTTTNLTGTTGQVHAYATGLDGYPRIVTSTPEYIRCTNVDCTTKVTTTLTGVNTNNYASSLEIGSDGFARLMFVQGLDINSVSIQFVQCTNADCTTKNVNNITSGGNPGFLPSMQIGSDGFARIVSNNGFFGNGLYFNRCTNASCSAVTSSFISIANLQYTSPNSMQIGSDGFARIVANKSSTAEVVYIRCTNADCTSNVVTTVDDLVTNDSFFLHAALELGSDGYGRIAYRDAATGDLKFTQCTNADCSTKNTTTIDNSSNNVGDNVSIAMGSDGYARIVYKDSTASTIKYISCTSADCSTRKTNSLLSTGSVSYANSLTLNGSNLGQIAYYDTSNKFVILGNDVGYIGTSGSSLGTSALRYANNYSVYQETERLVVKTASNSNTALQVQNTSGSNVLVVDTANQRVGIATGAVAPLYDLTFGGGVGRTIAVATQPSANSAGSSLTILGATGNGTGAGGALVLQAGTGGATNANGGSVTITAGAKTGSGSGGQVIIKPGTSSDRTDFFQVQNALGTGYVLNVNTTNNRVGINTNTPSYDLDIGTSSGTLNIGSSNGTLRLGIANTLRNSLGYTQLFDNNSGVYISRLVNSSNYASFKPTGGLNINTIAGTNTSLNVAGSIQLEQLVNNATFTVAAQGTTGSTTWGYRITAVDGFGETIATSEITIANGNATLDGTNYNRLTLGTHVNGAVSYNVYRTTASGTPSSTGLIGSMPYSPSSTIFQDTGLAASGSLPSANTTGQLTVANQVRIGIASSVNGKLVVNNSTNSNTVTIVSGATSANYTLTLPTALGSTGDCLKDNGSGALGFGSCGASGGDLQSAYDAGSAGDQVIALSSTNDSLIFRNPASSGTDSNQVVTIDQLNTGAKDALVVNNAGTGNILNLQDAGTTVLKVTDGGNITALGASTGTTGTTEATARTNVTTLELTAAGSFANNDVIFINNAGQDYYTRIVSGGGTTTLTVSPEVSYDASATVTKYNLQNIGASTTDYTTQSNRFFQGYFLGGVVTGAGSTTLSDGSLTSTNGLKLQTNSGVIIKNTSDSDSALLVQNAAGNSLLTVDTTNSKIIFGSHVDATTIQDGFSDDLSTTTPTGTLLNAATHVSGQYVELNNTSGQNGQVEYNLGVISGDFDITYEMYTSGNADAQFFYINNTSTPTVENQATGGYAVSFSEYYGSMALTYNGTTLATASSPPTFNDATWHDIQITKTGTTVQVYFDGVLEIGYTDISRTFTGTKFGLGARSGGQPGVHRVKNLVVSYDVAVPAIEPSVSVDTTTGETIFKSVTNSIGAFKIQDASANTIFNIDSSNQRIGINTTNPSAPLDVGVSAVSSTFSHGFESGLLSPMLTSGVVPWSIDGNSSNARTGTYSATATAATTTDLTLTKTLSSAGTITFYVSRSSFTGLHLYFYIDGAQQVDISGTAGYTQYSYAVSAGTHTFKWSIGNSGYGGSSVHLDDITITNVAASSQVAALNGAVSINSSATTQNFALDINTASTSSLRWLGVASSTSSPLQGGLLLHQYQTYGFQLATQNTASSAAGQLVFDYRSLSDASVAKANILTMQANGNVGIGTAAPNALLHVAVPTGGSYFTGFEGGTLGDVTSSGATPWTVANSGCYAGSFCAINDMNNPSTLTLTKTLSSAGTISFWFSKNTWMNGSFKIDGVQQVGWGNGGLSATYYSYSVSAGAHTFTWESTASVGNGDARVDEITVTNVAGSSVSAAFDGNVGIGTTSATKSIDVRGDALFRNSSNSTTAFSVQNSNSVNVLNIDTTNGELEVGSYNGGTNPVNGKLVVNNSTNSNTVTIVSGATSSSYTLTLPTALGASGDCLKDTTGTGVLGFGSCGGGAGGLAKDATDTSSASVSAAGYLYSFTNSNSAVTGGVLSLDNGTNTGNALRVTTSGNPTTGLIFASNTNASPSGNLLDLQSGSSPTSKFSVTAAGAVTAAGLIQGNLGLTTTGATVNINASSNFNTNINTGTSTGNVTIGNSNATSVISIIGGANATGLTLSTAAGANGSVGSIGGTIAVTAGNGGNGSSTSGGNGGSFSVTAGNGGTANNGNGGLAGTISLTAGNGGPTAIGATGRSGGAITLTAGNGGNGATSAGNGGAIILKAGLKGTTGGAEVDGDINTQNRNFNVKDIAGTNTILSVATGGARGLVSVALGNTASTAALCTSLANATAPTANVLYELRDCSAAPAADYAEMYPVVPGATYGDIVAVGTNMVNTYGELNGAVDWNTVIGQVTQLVKTNQAYQQNVIGIVSNNYGDFTSAGHNIKDQDNPMPVALNGRVPVKIASTSAAINPGDYITTSASEIGKGEKAMAAGIVIGKALEAWSPSSGKTTVMIYVEQGYYPGPTTAQTLQGTGLNVTGNAMITGNLSIDANLYVSGETTLESLIVTGGAVFNGNLTVQNITVANITINGKIITAGNTPTANIGTAAGIADPLNNIVAPSVTIAGNDTSGTITIVAGANTTAGNVAEIVFDVPFTGTPRAIVSAKNANSANLQIFNITQLDKLILTSNNAPTAGQTYQFDYIIVQ